MNWLTRLIQAINKEYDRRIKSASEVAEYGMHHDHGHGHASHAHTPHHAAAESHPKPAENAQDEQPEEQDEAVISNVVPGTRLDSSSGGDTGSRSS